MSVTPLSELIDGPAAYLAVFDPDRRSGPDALRSPAGTTPIAALLHGWRGEPGIWPLG